MQTSQTNTYKTQQSQKISAQISRMKQKSKFVYFFGKMITLIQLYMIFFILPKILYYYWPWITASLSKQWIYFLGISLPINIISLLYNLIMIPVYKLKIPFLQQFRILNKPWPWQQNKQKWNQTLKKTLTQVLMNSFFWGPLFMTIAIITDSLQYDLSIENWPNTFTILWQFCIFMLVEDCIFYFSHKTLHHPKLYELIHKKHHQYYHTVTICATYAHPIQYIFGNSLPASMGAMILIIFCPIHFALRQFIFLSFCSKQSIPKLEERAIVSCVFAMVKIMII